MQGGHWLWPRSDDRREQTSLNSHPLPARQRLRVRGIVLDDASSCQRGVFKGLDLRLPDV
jgi:hypothetical protein